MNKIMKPGIERHGCVIEIDTSKAPLDMIWEQLCNAHEAALDLLGIEDDLSEGYTNRRDSLLYEISDMIINFIAEENGLRVLFDDMDWVDELDEIDRDCVATWHWLLGRPLASREEYNNLESMIDAMVIEYVEYIGKFPDKALTIENLIEENAELKNYIVK